MKLQTEASVKSTIEAIAGNFESALTSAASVAPHALHWAIAHKQFSLINQLDKALKTPNGNDSQYNKALRNAVHGIASGIRFMDAKDKKGNKLGYQKFCTTKGALGYKTESGIVQLTDPKSFDFLAYKAPKTGGESPKTSLKQLGSLAGKIVAETKRRAKLDVEESAQFRAEACAAVLKAALELNGGLDGVKKLVAAGIARRDGETEVARAEVAAYAEQLQRDALELATPAKKPEAATEQTDAKAAAAKKQAAVPKKPATARKPAAKKPAAA